MRVYRILLDQRPPWHRHFTSNCDKAETPMGGHIVHSLPDDRNYGLVDSVIFRVFPSHRTFTYKLRHYIINYDLLLKKVMFKQTPTPTVYLDSRPLHSLHRPFRPSNRRSLGTNP